MDLWIDEVSGMWKDFSRWMSSGKKSEERLSLSEG